METVTKAALACRIATKVGCTRTLAYQAIDVLFEAITDTIIQGRRIEIRTFGVWVVRNTKAKRAHNPRTGEELFVPARRKVHFKPGRLIKEALSRPLEAED